VALHLLCILVTSFTRPHFKMRYLLLLLIAFGGSCETHSFDGDQRQLTAKDIIRNKVHNTRSFDITGFTQDTLQSYEDTAFKRPLRYKLDFTYTDSLGNKQNKTGVVIFTPDGKSVINSRIIESGEH
jgi:hypothetical protein